MYIIEAKRNHMQLIAVIKGLRNDLENVEFESLNFLNELDQAVRG